MKFIIKIQEPASFFYLLESLSNWNSHTRKDNRIFLKNKFKFNIRDKILLKKYSRLRRKYPWKQIDSDFILCEDFKQVEKRLKRRLNEKEFILMKKIIKTFNERFNSIYKNYKQQMIKRKKLLEELIKTYKLEAIIKEIEKFYEVENNLKKIDIYLLANPSGRGGGGANVFPANCIQLEPKKLNKNNKENAKRDLAIIIHEITHLIEKRTSQKKWREFEENVKSNNLNFTILREAIVSSMAPEGYMTKKYSITKSFQNSKSEIRKISKKIYPLTEKQFESKRTFFQGDYLKKCIEVYKND